MNKRRLIFWLVLACFAWVVIRRTGEIEQIWETLQQGEWAWVAAATLAQAGQFVLLTLVYKTTFGVVGVRGGLLNLLPVVLSSHFVNIVTPSVGMGGVALMVDDAAQRGESGARAAAGMALAAVSIYVVLALLLVFSITYLILYGTLSILVVISAIFFFFFSGTILYLLILGYWNTERLARLMYQIQRLINRIVLRFRPKPALELDWSSRTAREFTAGATAIGERPRRLWLLFLVSFGPHAANMLTLFAVFLAFSDDVITLPLLVTSYAIMQLISVASPTPQGFGFVETILPATLISLGVPAATATVVVLAYRGLTFWLPLVVGFFVIQRSKSLGAGQPATNPQWKKRMLSWLSSLSALLKKI